MHKSPTDTLSGPLQDSVDTAAEALKAATSSSHEFTEQASELLATATAEIAKLAESLRGQAVDAAKEAARYAKQEVELHPMASLAAALTAVAAVMGMMAVNRRGKPASQ